MSMLDGGERHDAAEWYKKMEYWSIEILILEGGIINTPEAVGLLDVMTHTVIWSFSKA